MVYLIMNKKVVFISIVLVFTCLKGNGQNQMLIKKLDQQIKKLYPLHQKKIPPQSGDWLAVHYEPGQTFEQYLAAKPTRSDQKLNTIYIQPIGEFTTKQQKVVELSAEYISVYFNLPVKILNNISSSAIPSRARRTHPSWGMKQILTTYLLDELLLPHRPDNALAMLGLTAIDLWPGHGWNFVFGQASLHERVGVWSLYRNGNPDESAEMFRLCLRRTIKTAVHEICHILTMQHCIDYECIMNGSNHREESDRRPLYLCPICLKKLCWNLGIDPLKRYQKLEAFCNKIGFQKEQYFFHKSIDQLKP